MTPTPEGLFGGIQVSLDMEKAFDSISREVAQRALQLIHLPHDVVNAIQIWLAPHKYYIPFKTMIGGR